MFTFQLNENYKVVAKLSDAKSVVQFELFHKNQKVGSAQLVTDYCDVAMIVGCEVDPHHQKVQLEQRTIDEVFIKIILKHLPVVRKPEFRFAANITEGSRGILIDKYHFIGTTDHALMICQEPTIPENLKTLEDISVSRTLSVEQKQTLLNLLKQNAYWAENYTPERLELLTNHAECYCLFHQNQLVGFSRVVTDHEKIASLWDVVIRQDYRGKGFANALMKHVFSDPATAKVGSWILYTDNAHKLYEKFGFKATDEITSNQILYKLRLQEQGLPKYSATLKQRFFPTAPDVTLSQTMTAEFLSTKREKLAEFLDRNCGVITHTFRQ